MKIPPRAVIDTNVLIVANGKAPHVPDDCVVNATEFLELAQESVVVLDSGYEIFDEYQRYCSFKGQPGVGDRFFLYLHQSQADIRRVQIVNILKDVNGSYLAIPVSLSKFDRSDQKFVATVIADDYRSTIVNCADSDWRESARALSEESIDVLELCSDNDSGE